MKKQDYQLFLELINSASFRGDKAEYVVEVKQRIIKEIEKPEVVENTN